MTGLAEYISEPIFHGTRDIAGEDYPGRDYRVTRREVPDRIGEFAASRPRAPLGRAMIHRDSLFSRLIGSVAALFRETDVPWINAWNLDRLNAHDPVVVIEQVVERDLSSLGSGYFRRGTSR